MEREGQAAVSVPRVKGTHSGLDLGARGELKTNRERKQTLAFLSHRLFSGIFRGAVTTQTV